MCLCNSNTPLFHAPPLAQGCGVDQTPWAFSGFQISVTDYPAISGLCLFDFLYRLKAIPNQTSFIDETTQPPGPWINTTRLVVYACRCRGQRHQSVLEKSPHFTTTERTAVVSHKRPAEELSLTAQAKECD